MKRLHLPCADNRVSPNHSNCNSPNWSLHQSSQDHLTILFLLLGQILHLGTVGDFCSFTKYIIKYENTYNNTSYNAKIKTNQ